MAAGAVPAGLMRTMTVSGQGRSGRRASERLERIDLEGGALSGDSSAVVRLIIGGIAEGSDFAFEEIDDLQLAVERLLAEACAVDTVQLRFEVGMYGMRTRAGPCSAAEGLSRRSRTGSVHPASSPCAACCRRSWTPSLSIRAPTVTPTVLLEKLKSSPEDDLT